MMYHISDVISYVKIDREDMSLAVLDVCYRMCVLQVRVHGRGA